MAPSKLTEEVDNRIYKKLAKEIVGDIKSNECNEVSINTNVSVGHGKWCIEVDMIIDFNLLLNQPNLFITINTIEILEGKIIAPDDKVYYIDEDILLTEIKELCKN